jgi:putative DNA primase/helicase
MFDSGIERAWLAALIADPSWHDSSTVSLQDLGDPHARAAFEAFANVRARGETPTNEFIRAELERTYELKTNPRPGESAELSWFDRLAAAEISADAPVKGWESTILECSARRARAKAKAEAKIAESHMRNDAALVFAEPSAPRPLPRAKRKHRLRIEVTTDVADVIDQAQQALLEAGGVYVRGQMLVHIVRNFGAQKWLRVPSGLPTICQVVDARLWEMMSASAEWKKYDGRREKFVDAKPPEWAPKTLRARDQWPFPVLDGISDTPVLRPDGTIHDKPGYDAGSRTFYAPGGVTWPTVKAEPTHHDAVTALAELAEPFCDFPFVAPSDKSAALALILSIMGRSAIDGPVPMFKAGSSTPGAGKGLISDVATIIATGNETSKMAHTANEEETRKRLFALAISAPAVVMMDNIEGSFGGPTWAMVLTAGTITDRLLGASADRTVPIRSVFVLTGNNIQLQGDTGRRVIPIDIDPKCEHPQDRSGFRYPNLKEYVSTERPRLASTALILLRAYFVAGRPDHGKPLMGSFEGWDRVVRGAITWEGGADPCGGIERIRDAGDADLERLRALIGAWYVAFGERPVFVNELLQRALNDLDLRTAIDAYGIRGDPMTSVLLGKRLASLQGRLVANRRIMQAGRGHAGAMRWQIDLVRW